MLIIFALTTRIEREKKESSLSLSRAWGKSVKLKGNHISYGDGGKSPTLLKNLRPNILSMIIIGYFKIHISMPNDLPIAGSIRWLAPVPSKYD